VSVEEIKKEDLVVPDDAVAPKEEAVVEEDSQEPAGEIEGEDEPAATRRRTRRDT
jgi:hypothetical protein